MHAVFFKTREILICYVYLRDDNNNYGEDDDDEGE